MTTKQKAWRPPYAENLHVPDYNVPKNCIGIGLILDQAVIVFHSPAERDRVLTALHDAIAKTPHPG